jgi:cell division septum initiation protein DivIVA
MVLRGYDRIEVDEYIEKLLTENATLRRELESSSAQRPAPAPRAASEEPATASSYYDVDTPAEDSFGFRAEKLLRLAEREAAEMRTRATRDAEAAEAAARRRAEEQLRAAEREAAEIRTRATQEAAQVQKQAGQEAARVTYLHRSTKDELRRLAGLLNAELARPDPDAADAPGTADKAAEPRSGDAPRPTLRPADTALTLGPGTVHPGARASNH